MKVLTLNVLAITMTLLGIHSSSLAVEGLNPNPVEQLMEWEFHANAFNDPKKRGEQFYTPEFYLVPRELTEVFKSERVNPKMANYFEVEKDGKSYIRIPINPEDTKFHPMLAKFLRASGASDALHKDEGITHIKSASRSSWMNVNPEGSYGFTGKVSTNNTGGSWRDKNVNFNQVFKARLASDLTDPIEEKMKLKSLLALEEPMGVVVDRQGLNQGMVLRNYDSMVNSGHYLMPGFSALHEEWGPKLAKMNGSEDPTAFWFEHYVKPLAVAQAELAAYTTISLESAHSQQYLIELNKKGQPTGKIGFRDYNDSYITSAFFHQKNKKELLDAWLDHWKKDNLEVRFGIFHGPGMPSWVDKTQMDAWVKGFFETFEQRFSELTGVPLEELQKIPYPKAGVNKYSKYLGYKVKKYPVKNNPQFKNWLLASACFQGETQTTNGVDCVEVLDCFNKDNTHSRSGYQCREVFLALEQEKAPLLKRDPLVPFCHGHDIVNLHYNKRYGKQFLKEKESWASIAELLKNNK